MNKHIFLLALFSFFTAIMYQPSINAMEEEEFVDVYAEPAAELYEAWSPEELQSQAEAIKNIDQLMQEFQDLKSHVEPLISSTELGQAWSHEQTKFELLQAKIKDEEKKLIKLKTILSKLKWPQLKKKQQPSRADQRTIQRINQLQGEASKINRTLQNLKKDADSLVQESPQLQELLKQRKKEKEFSAEEKEWVLIGEGTPEQYQPTKKSGFLGLW